VPDCKAQEEGASRSKRPEENEPESPLQMVVEVGEWRKTMAINSEKEIQN
jgi:hypothetical protein